MSSMDETEMLLCNLLAEASPVLSRAGREEIQTFIDVGDFGPALVATVDIYVEENKIASPDVISLIKRLASVMSMESAPLLQRLPQQLHVRPMDTTADAMAVAMNSRGHG